MSSPHPPPSPDLKPWQQKLHTVIFEADTPGGKAFDVGLLFAIVLSVLAVCLESVKAIKDQYGELLYGIEWALTILFTIEYVLRLACVGKPLRYAFSFFGIVDLLAIVPTYISLFFPKAQSLVVVRALRLLRIFRVLKLGHFVGEAATLRAAMRASARKIIIFLGAVLCLVLIMGSLMYLVEGEEHGFTSIPQGIYWAIVTLTTVGYGDIAPATVLGKALASSVMIMGYAIIAVPTGIVSVELARWTDDAVSTQACPNCMLEGHHRDAVYCHRCGTQL